jgi:hypothetical protein
MGLRFFTTAAFKRRQRAIRDRANKLGRPFPTLISARKNWENSPSAELPGARRRRRLSRDAQILRSFAPVCDDIKRHHGVALGRVKHFTVPVAMLCPIVKSTRPLEVLERFPRRSLSDMAERTLTREAILKRINEIDRKFEATEPGLHSIFVEGRT